MARAMKVAIVDDEADMRQSISQWLALSGFDTETYASAEDALKVIGPDFQGVVVSDIKMPGMDGMAFLKRLMGQDSGLPVILITGHGDVPMAVEAMHHGAFDFIQKPFRDQELLDRINQALGWDQEHRSEEDHRRNVQERFLSLTPREREVMDCVVRGLANKVIAMDLDLSQRTVEIHRARVMEKMNARSLADLVRMSLFISNPAS
jgi:FixJ family two-component response regulator